MAATIQDICRWLEKANFEVCTHVIVVCDTYDHSDYPVYVMKDANVREVEEYYRKQNMQQVMEVYSLSVDIEMQLAEDRAFHYE